MRVVVTGGLGALGSHVVGAQWEAGHDPIVASRPTGVDLETGSGVDAVLRGADAEVHTDSTYPRRFDSVTVGAARTLIAHLPACPIPRHQLSSPP